jgi:hypothetical protein
VSITQQKTDLKKTLAKLTVAYYHWRDEGFPDDHVYHLWVAPFEQQLSDLGREE